jgi:hypothetical protein
MLKRFNGLAGSHELLEILGRAAFGMTTGKGKERFSIS